MFRRLWRAVWIVGVEILLFSLFLRADTIDILPASAKKYLDDEWSPVAYVVLIAATCAVLLYRLQARLDELTEMTPVLRFGPIHTHGKVYIEPVNSVMEVKMWRISISNDGGSANTVQVTGRFTPGLPEMPGSSPIISFHRYRDTGRTFPLQGNGATEYVDLIGVSTHNHSVSFVASAEAEGGYIYYEHDQFGEPDYWRLDLEARAGVAITRRSALIWFDGGQWMYMAGNEDSDPIS